MYVNSIKTKTTSDGQGKNPQIVKQTVATALVEGNNILGTSCFTWSFRIWKDLDQIQCNVNYNPSSYVMIQGLR